MAPRLTPAARPGTGATRRAFGARAAALGAGAGATTLTAACAPRGGAEPPGTKLATPATITWAMYDGPPLLDAAARAARIFKERHPSVTLHIEGVRNQTNVLTAWLGGAGPHVLAGWDTPLVEMGRQGFALGLDPYVRRDARAVPLSDYSESHLKAVRWPGVGLFGLPEYISIEGLFYNKALFQKRGLAPPDDTWDWPRYADASRRLTTAGAGPAGDAPSLEGEWAAVDVGALNSVQLIFQNGGDLVDPNDERRAAFGSPAALEALQWVHDRLWRERSWAPRSVPGPAGYKDHWAMLAGGKLAMWGSGSWAPAEFAVNHPGAVQDWDVAPLPRGKVRATRQGIDTWIVWKDAPALDQCWELMKFVQTAEWLDLQATLAGYQHPRVSMQDHWAEMMKKANPALAGKNLQAFSHAVKNRYARTKGFWRKDADAWKIFSDAYAAAIVRNEQPVADAFRDAARRVDALMA
jgi:multiple sugar transport system substrate-binding protein